MTEQMEIGILCGGAAIFGGLIGGLVSGVYGHLKEIWESPKLCISFVEKKGANIVETAWKENEKSVERVIVRASVENKGRRAATNCRVYLVKMQEVRGAKIAETEFYDPMQLPWAGWKFAPREVPNGINFYFDLIRVRKDISGWDFTFERSLSTHEILKGYRGTYRFVMAVTADNAKTSYGSIDVDYNGDWHNLRAWETS